MLIAQVRLQVAQTGAVEVAQPTPVGPDVVVPRHVRPQFVGTAAREGAFVTAEDDASEVTRQHRAPHLYGNHAFL